MRVVVLAVFLIVLGVLYKAMGYYDYEEEVTQEDGGDDGKSNDNQ